MHPIQLRTGASGLMKGKQLQKKGGFIGPLMGVAAPLLGSILPNIFERVFPRKGDGKKMAKRLRSGGMSCNKAGLAPPYGGKKSKMSGRGAFQPGPLA